MNSPPRRNKNRNLAASHQRSWLWGRHAVLETIRAGKWPIRELFLADDLPATLVHEVRQSVVGEIRHQFVTSERIAKLCRADDHQGFLARMGEFPCGTLSDLQQALVNSIATENAPQGSMPGLFVICDRIQDAQNLGAILRCCDAMRVDGIVIGEKTQVAITPHVARASAGSVNHLAIFCVSSLSAALDEVKKAGFAAVAASEKAELTLWQASFHRPLTIVIGSESAGISSELLSRCDLQVSIPMLGGVNSLNAAVAAGIVLYECRRQQMNRIIPPE